MLLLHYRHSHCEINLKRFDPCSSMKVLGSWCDDKGGSTGAPCGQCSDRQQCFFLQTRHSAEGSRTAHCGKDKSFRSNKRGLDVARRADASRLGGTLYQNNETMQGTQLGDTSSLHEAHGCPGWHLKSCVYTSTFCYGCTSGWR